MGKQDLIDPQSRDRLKWSPEALTMESIFKLAKKLKETGLMDKFLDNKIPSEELKKSINNTELFQCVTDLREKCFKLLQIEDSKKDKKTYLEYFQILNELGMILVKSQWWQRYEVITSKMGIECILSIRTAESLFKRDPFAEEIKQVLLKLIKEEI